MIVKKRRFRHNAETPFSLRLDTGYFEISARRYFSKGNISARKNEMLSINPGEECLPTDPCIRLIFLKRTLLRISAIQGPKP